MSEERTITVNGKQQYRFKTLEEFDKEFEKDEDGDYIVGETCFVEKMLHLAGLPIPDKFSKQIMKNTKVIWLDLQDIVHCKRNKWHFTREMLTLNEQETESAQPHSFCKTPEEKCTMNYCDDNGCQNRKRHLVEQLEISQEKIDAFNNRKWYIKGGRNLSNYLSSINYIGNKHCFLSGDNEEKGYFINPENVWSYDYIFNFKKRDDTEITVADYKKLSGIVENAQDELSEMENTEIVTDNSETLEHAKKLLQSNSYFVFPKAEEGDFPDLSGFEGVEMIIGTVQLGDAYQRGVFAKYKDKFITNRLGICDYVKPIPQPKLTPEEIVERLGEDYLLNLIKEKENGKL